MNDDSDESTGHDLTDDEQAMLVGGPAEGQELDLRVEFPCPMLGTQVADGPITIEQALSFEESVRAVFQSAREHGLLPAPTRKARR